MKKILLIMIVISLFADTAYCAKKKVSKQTTRQVDVHSYYKGLTQEQAEKADNVAKDIANFVMSKKELDTDLKKVSRATRIVAGFCARGTYGNDENRYYRSPYGVFIAGVYTCAGATRALGRILDFMGYQWQHANENQWTHQWNVLQMDGQIGFADGQGGFAAYGEYSMGNLTDDELMDMVERYYIMESPKQ